MSDLPLNRVLISPLIAGTIPSLNSRDFSDNLTSKCLTLDCLFTQRVQPIYIHITQLNQPFIKEPTRDLNTKFTKNIKNTKSVSTRMSMLQVFPSHHHFHGHVPAADVGCYEQCGCRVRLPRVQSQDDACVRRHLGRRPDSARRCGRLHAHPRHVITLHDIPPSPPLRC